MSRAKVKALRKALRKTLSRSPIVPSMMVKLDAAIDGAKCHHGPGNGRWVVRYWGETYGFVPATQLQKDLWLSVGQDRGEDWTQFLRWLCFACGTVQEP